VVLESLGHAVEESSPGAMDEGPVFVETFKVIVASHTALTLEQFGALIGRTLTAEDVESFTWSCAKQGIPISAGQYLAAIQWLQGWSRRAAQWWSDGFDLLLTPTVAVPPPPLGTLIPTPYSFDEALTRIFNLIPFTPQFNVTGQPAISLPLYWNSTGLPIGTQLVAAFGREDLLIQLAAQLEQARPWKDRRPPVCA
jgi:amidase